ncbi:hypothetical protein TrVFT333_008635 [Trichoderma virens FT-333]|nr:hypothetical protein TrVFT333_008635 [Trichoderma virens FT-333]
MTGNITITFLQATIFIAIYESATPDDWVELEEMRRVWWGVLILDRLVNLGNPLRMLATEEPKSEHPLPVDDTTWDNGLLIARNGPVRSVRSSDCAFGKGA